MIIFDEIGHLVSTESEEELHQFAKMIGLRRSWYQTNKNNPHYVLTISGMRGKARRFGAIQVDPIELIKKAWWYEGSCHQNILERTGK